MAHRFQNDPQALLKEGKAILKKTTDPIFACRITLVSLLLRGKIGTRELAEASGVSQSSLQAWVRAVDADGWYTLASKPRPGRPRILSEEQVKELRQVVQDDPSKHGFQQWTRTTLANYIQKTYNVSFSMRSAEDLLPKLRQSPRNPAPPGSN